MRTIGILMFLLAVQSAPVLADDQFVTYVMLNGRYVELTGTEIPCDGFDGFLAIEANNLSNGKAGQDNTDLRVYCWQRIGSNIVLHRDAAELTLPDSEIQIGTIDRAPSESDSQMESLNRPAPV